MIKTSYFQSLSISLVLHLAFLWFFASYKPPIAPAKGPVAVEIIYKDKNHQPQFVTDPKIGKLLDQLKKHSQFLSKFNQTVKKQQVARLNGKTKNQKPQNKKQTNRKKLSKKQKGIGKFLPQKPQLGANFRLMPSTISEYIPNIDKGGFTALNTNQFTFYTFFSRINEQVRFRWIRNIHNFSSILSVGQINKLARHPRVTKIEILLDKSGQFVKAQVNSSSGSHSLDLAAENAFEDAAPFSNPPPEMLEADGYIHLRYSFHVIWKPRFLAKSKE